MKRSIPGLFHAPVTFPCGSVFTMPSSLRHSGVAVCFDMDKRKFLFVSLSGLIGDIAWQILKEGHDVRYYIDNEKERDIADGFVPKSKDWEKDAKWADIVVFDDTLGQGEKARELRASGKPVIGGSPYTDRLEDDRSFGQEELKKAGVNIIPYEDFDSFDPA